MKQLYSAIIVTTSLFFCSLIGTTQTNEAKANTDNFKTDSVELRQLIFKLLKWKESELPHNEDFPLITDKANDSIYIGINWVAHKRRIKQLENTGLFTQEFISTYQKIAEHLDKELKQNKIKYYVGELPPYDHANEWCDCQDYPINVWKRLRITNVKITDHLASFKWTWARDFFYSVKAQKTNGKWKIAQLEKFSIKNFIW